MTYKVSVVFTISSKVLTVLDCTVNLYKLIIKLGTNIGISIFTFIKLCAL